MYERFTKFSGSVFSLMRLIQQLETKEMEKYGLKGSFAQYLLVLLRCPAGMPAAELAKACDKDKAAVSRAIGQMQNKGLVMRAEAENYYRAPIVLTEHGKEAAEYVKSRATHMVENATTGVSEQDRAIMYMALDKIFENLQSIIKEEN